MTKEQLREGKDLIRRIRGEEHHLVILELDVEMGGRAMRYSCGTPDEIAREKKTDLDNLARVKARIEWLKQKFAAL